MKKYNINQCIRIGLVALVCGFAANVVSAQTGNSEKLAQPTSEVSGTKNLNGSSVPNVLYENGTQTQTYDQVMAPGEFGAQYKSGAQPQ